MTYAGGANYERAARFFYGCLIIAIASMAIYVMLRPAKPDPPNSRAFGCYMTSNAPPILLGGNSMTVLQSAPLRIGYHLELNKTGIDLIAEAPIAAEPVGSRYTYAVRPPGVGWSLPFSNEIDDHRYGVFDENQLREFTMLASDGNELLYRKASPDLCRR